MKIFLLQSLMLVVQSEMIFDFKESRNLAEATKIVLEESFPSVINLISSRDVKNFDVSDFKNNLLSMSFIGSKFVIRQESADKISQLSGIQRRTAVLIIRSFAEFLDIYKRISSNLFMFNGNYLIVLVNGEISEIPDMFQLSWKLQIYNVVVMYELLDGVLMKSFLPMNRRSCNDTNPIIVNNFNNGSFASKNFFPDKMTNLFNCPVRIVAKINDEPYVLAKRLTNGNFEFSGQNIRLVTALAKSLSFKVELTVVDREGYLFDNGSSDGLMKALMEGRVNLALSNSALRPNRMKFFDRTTTILNEKVIFVIPPGRDFTAFEKIIYPFSLSLWLGIIVCLLFGYFVIFILKHRSKMEQNFVFGTNVQTPYLNMFIGYIGGVQPVLPRRNFARFLLMMFLMYTLVMRSLYEGLFYELLHSNKRHQEVQSLDELIEKKFQYYDLEQNIDLYEGSFELPRRR